MSRSVGQRILALFGAEVETSVGLVMGANALASLALGVVSIFELGLPVEFSLVMIPVSFLLLTASLFNRRTVWVAAVVGSIINAGLSAFVLSAFVGNLHPLAPWLGGPLGFLLGAGCSIWAYLDVARTVAREDR